MESAVKKKSPRKIRFRKLKKAPPGAAPGTMSISDDALKPHVRIISYNEASIEDKAFEDVNSIKSHLLDNPTLTHWVEVKGFGDRAFFESMCDAFNIHRLEMEDVLSGHQRPKVEESDHHLFIVSRAITNGDDFLDEQVSLFIFKNFVISFQERQNDIFLAVKDRLQQNRGVLR
ncbi:MAG: CorA family divalent cation transporter, partial [Bacteroidota bacterium]